MKKIFIVFVFLFLFCSFAFAENNTIPIDMNKQYKKEMEQIINSEYPRTIKNIKNLVERSNYLYNKIKLKGFNLEDYINLILISETSIPASDLYLYVKLLTITQEKYLGIKYQQIETDDSTAIFDKLYPYFKANNVNIHKLTKIVHYEKKNIETVEKYIKEIEELRQ